MGDLDLLERLLDVRPPLLRVRVDVTLVRGHTAQAQAVDQGVPLDLVQVTDLFALELDQQQIDAVETHAGGLVDARLDGQLHPFLEPPERIGRHGDWIAPASSARLVCRLRDAARSRATDGRRGRTGQEPQPVVPPDNCLP